MISYIERAYLFFLDNLQSPCSYIGSPVIDADHDTLLAASPSSTMATVTECRLQCSSYTKFYYSDDNVCLCEPQLRLQRYINGTDKNAISNVYTDYDKVYLS